MAALIRYDAACLALAEAKSVDEARDIRDKSEAVRCYARQAKNKQLEVDAAEIRLRAERRLGEILRDTPKNTGAQGIGKSAVPTENRTPTLSDLGIDKKLSSRAQRLAAVPVEEFEEQIGEWRERVTAENERVTTSLIRRGERAERDERLAQPVTPVGMFGVIYADPPWRYDYSATENRDIENQYPTMDLAEICALPVPEFAAPDCVLFLWATSPKLAESLKVVEAWGFEYRTCGVWDKEVIGMGYYFRQQHELLLIATKGQPGVPDPPNRVSSVIRSRREAHSKKPDVVYRLIESMYPQSRRVELFARSQRDGWSAWGNQA